MKNKHLLFTSSAGMGHLTPISGLAKAGVSLGYQVRVAVPESFVKNVKKMGLEAVAVDDSDKTDPAFKELSGVGGNLSDEETVNLMGKVIFGYTNTKYALVKTEEFVKKFQPSIIFSEECEMAGPMMALKYKIPFVRVGISQRVMDLNFLSSMVRGAKPLLEKEGIGGKEFQDFIEKSTYVTYFPETFESEKHKVPKGQTIRLLLPAPKREIGKGKPLVFVTLGTIAANFGFYPRVIQQIIEGLKGLEIEGLVAVGNQADPKLLKGVPENIKVENWVDQREILKKADLVVCHGGSNTVLDTLFYGIPLLVLPLFADQLVNAERVKQLQLGILLKDDGSLSGQVREGVRGLLGKKNRALEKISQEMQNQLPVKEALNQIFQQID